MGYILNDLTGAELNAIRDEIDKAIVVFGSTENHGPHLPFCTDSCGAYELSKKIVEKIKGAVLLPPVAYGVSSHHMGFFMTITLRPEVLIQVAEDIFRSIICHGIKHIVAIIGHDGNIEPVVIASRNVKNQIKDVKIVLLEAWWQTVYKLLPKDTFEVWDGYGHGGEMETSIMMALLPELVDFKEARNVQTVLPNLPSTDMRIIWDFHELSSTGITGAPSKGTPEKGKKIVDSLTNYLVDFIESMDEQNWNYSAEKL